MKCPKCGYHSFDHLDSCKKCSHDLVAHKEKFSLRGFFSPKQTTTATITKPEPLIDENDEEEGPSTDGSVDFGFDFLDEEDDPVQKSTKDILLGNDQDINIDQPFGVDGETVPADVPAPGSKSDSGDKPEKGPEFAF